MGNESDNNQCGGKKRTGTSGKVFPLVHIILRFVFVENVTKTRFSIIIVSY